MTCIALYGGAFNPIGKHHIDIANNLLKYNIVDEVWLVPCYVSMSKKQLIIPEHRLQMCQIAIQCNNNPRIKLSDFEIKHKLIDSSYEIIKKMYQEMPDKKFFLLIGSDNAININRWPNAEKLINEIPFIVVPRPNSPLDSDWCLKLPHYYLQDFPISSNSSTEIRNKINDSNVVKLVNNEVLAYIKLYNLL